MKTMVISGINIFEGGPLSVYTDCLDKVIESKINKHYEVIAFVHNKDLFNKYRNSITIIELPNSRKNYLIRLCYEYIYFYFYSKNKNIDIWLSLHDITPNVKAAKRFVYCHNPSPFYKMSKLETRFAPKLKLFNLFYKYLYKINIKKNDYVIVQQNWIKNKFIEYYGIDNVIVSNPDIKMINKDTIKDKSSKKTNRIFFYPSFPRVFKNFEVVCEAVDILAKKGLNEFLVILTINGSENSYSNYIVSKYEKNKNIRFIGLLNRKAVYEYYEKSDYLIFPSKLETWGLPITEYKEYGKPIIAADLSYAKETVGNYDKVVFFNPYEPHVLANIMEKCINNELEWLENRLEFQPDANSWEELLQIIIN